VRLLWTERARCDLLSIIDYIGRDSPAAARRTVAAIRKKALALNERPHSGRIVPELSRPEVRELIHGNYRLVYLVAADEVVVLTVFEGHRLLPEDVGDDCAT